MRKVLKKMKELGRQKYEARIDKIRTRHNKNFIMLAKITYQGKLVTDHMWLTYDEQFHKLYEGNKISFEADIEPYVKGYVGTNPKIQKRSFEEYDYKLTNISNVEKVISQKK